MRSRQQEVDNNRKQNKTKQKKNDYIKSADAVRGEGQLGRADGGRGCATLASRFLQRQTPPHQHKEHTTRQTRLG